MMNEDDVKTETDEEQCILTLTHEDMGEFRVNMRPALGIAEDDPEGASPLGSGVFHFVRNVPQVVPRVVFDVLKGYTRKSKRDRRVLDVFTVGKPPEVCEQAPLDAQVEQMRAHQAATDERLQRVLATLEAKAELVASGTADSPEVVELQAAQKRTDERLDALMGLMEQVVAEKGPRVTASLPRRKRGRPRKHPLPATQSVGTDALGDLTVAGEANRALGSQA